LRVRYRNETSTFDVRCVHPDHLYLEKTIITEGRFLDDPDLKELRKVAVIGVRVKDAIFKKEPALGKNIEVNGVAFKVVGVFTDEGGENEQEKIYLPITTAQRAFGGSNKVAMIMMTTGDAPVERTKEMSKEIRKKLADSHAFSM